MVKLDEIQMRDPFVLPDLERGTDRTLPFVHQKTSGQIRIFGLQKCFVTGTDTICLPASKKKEWPGELKS
mgnify:CR=1 FL=1